MTTTEAPFLKFWRELDAELDLSFRPPADVREATIFYGDGTGTPQAAAEYLIESRQDDAADQANIRAAMARHAPPTHTRNAGKDL